MMLTSWSTTTTDTASGRSARLASWAAFKDAALPAPRVARTRPGTCLLLIGDTSAVPHAAAGITTAFSTTRADDQHDAVQGRHQLAHGKGHAQRQHSGTPEMAIPALNSAVSSWSAVTPAPLVANRSLRKETS
jgi:hypothetical protein